MISLTVQNGVARLICDKVRISDRSTAAERSISSNASSIWHCDECMLGFHCPLLLGFRDSGHCLSVAYMEEFDVIALAHHALS